MIKKKITILVLWFCCGISPGIAQDLITKLKIVDVAPGWARNSVNAVIFRHNSLTTFRDTQFIAFYNDNQQLVIGKRKTGSEK